MDDKRLVKTSKFLSKHLRHAPEAIGLQLSSDGWVDVDELLTACARANVRISRAELEEVVAQNNKQRFAFDETGTRIRANQGHSIEVELELEPITPPAELYHGTAAQNVDVILSDGLAKMRRHHVHLSADIETATSVGRRHGRPVVLVVDAGAMNAAGLQFYRSANGVWLVDNVPAQYLSILDSHKQ